MVGYTALGGSDTQFYPVSPEDVWTSLLAHLAGRRGVTVKSINEDLRRIEVNLGMTGFTGNCIASLVVDPAPGGASLRFAARMGAFSTLNIGGQRRIENERTKIFAGVQEWMLEDEDAVTEALAPGAPAGIAEQLKQLADLHTTGALTDDEFAAAKGRLLA